MQLDDSLQFKFESSGSRETPKRVKMKSEVFVIFQAALWMVGSCLNFNITNMSNCVDVPLDYVNDAEVEVRAITMEANAQGFNDVIHGKFLVHVHREHKDTELILVISKCPPGTTGICTGNSESFTTDMDCARFQTDKSGPWAMFSPAIDKRNPCAERLGEFEITGARMEGRFLEKYMKVEAGHYRIKLIHHLPGETMDTKNLRACTELDFDILA